MFEKSFKYLLLLKKNNTREWYHANKAMFVDARLEFEHITELLLYEVSRFDPRIAGLQPGDCIFRIYRDIRFSSDKTPYKTNFGTYLVPGGRKSGYAGYYLHIEPGGSFIAAGIYMPPSSVLTAIRKDIYNYHEEFKSILHSGKIKELFGEMSGEKLKSQPRGFPKDFEDSEFLKYKSYSLIRMKKDHEMMQKNAIREIVNCFQVSSPFIKFLNEAIDHAER